MGSSKKLASVVYLDGKSYGPDDDVPADVAKQITHPDAWADGSADDEEETVSDVAYADWKVADLKAEIDKRNEGRGEAEQLSKDGKQAELAALLAADDVSNAGA